MVRLPIEIAHQILSDVPLYRILATAASVAGSVEGDKFKDVLLSLPRQRSFLSDEEHLLLMVSAFCCNIVLSRQIQKHKAPSKK